MERPNKKKGGERPKVIKIRDAERILRKAGFKLEEGRKAKHDLYIHPISKERTILTRGSGQDLTVGITQIILDIADKYKVER